MWGTKLSVLLALIVCSASSISAADVDGGWSDWTAWGPCSVTCGTGLQARVRSCTNPEPQDNGAPCVGETSETRSCDASVLCKVDGGWTDWTEFGPCTKSCGGGQWTRTRTCTNPAPANGGENCQGVPSETQDCNTAGCPVDGEWSDWSYSACTSTCGGGTQTRQKTCTNPTPSNGGASCPGETAPGVLLETGLPCNTQACPIDGGWSDWTAFTDCSATCGGGHRSRTRSCTNPEPQFGGKNCSDVHGGADETETENCNEQSCPIHGNWGDWVNSACSKTCGDGTITRTRKCDTPAPAFGGDPCVGDTGSGTQTTSMNCNERLCPVNGAWSEWGPFSPCSATCGGGTQSRNKTCTNPSPSNGGDPCPGETDPGLFEEVINCNPNPCPVNGGWSDWTAYGPCSATCGGGNQIRTRSCTNPEPAHGGSDCPPSSSGTEVRTCNILPCPVDGKFTDWSAWGLCSATCDSPDVPGSPSRVRTRTCTDPAPQHGGNDCTGAKQETMACNVGVLCPKVGTWGAWGLFDTCTKTCDGGKKTRTRQCNHSAGYMPIPCPGSNSETVDCNTGLCPIHGNWGPWSAWTDCCPTRTRNRTRECDNPPPQHGGQLCQDYLNARKQEESCFVGTLCIGPPDTVGSNFVLMVLENKITPIHTAGNDIQLIITNTEDKRVEVRIQTPAATGEVYNIDKQIYLEPMSARTVTIKNNIRMVNSGIEPKGISITADGEVTVAAINPESESTDGLVVYPTDSLSTKYYMVCFDPSHSQPDNTTLEHQCQLGIVATKPSTVITIKLPEANNKVTRRKRATTFRGETKGAGETFTATLQTHEALLIQSSDDLTGASVTSTEPIAVFGGNIQAKIGEGTASGHIYEQLPPVTTWGKEFVTAPIPQRDVYKKGDIFRIIASEDNTVVTITHIQNIIVKNIPTAGWYLEINIGFGRDKMCSHITTSKPVMVLQFVQSQVGTDEPADPSFIIVPPVPLYLPGYSFTTPVNSSEGQYTNYVLIAVKDDAEKANLLIDDKELSGVTWCTIPDKPYVTAALKVSTGSHVIKTRNAIEPFMALLYGVGVSSESYGYTAGMRLAEINGPCSPTQGSIDDGIDNDCDGRIDEEYCDAEDANRDNDADGRFNEDCISRTKVNGNWAEWQAWTACSVTCSSKTQNGTRSRQRTCTNPAPMYGGTTCAGLETETQDCFDKYCPINGGFTAWSNYDTCSKTCGGGVQKRTRSCTNPEPEFGGSGCSGSTEETRTCNTDACPVSGQWNPWGDWSRCVCTPGAKSGKRTRTRTCNNADGTGCVGGATEEIDCSSSCKKLGESCTSSDQCNANDAECKTVCTCKSDYRKTGDFSCSKLDYYLGEQCTTNDQCTSFVKLSECRSDKCVCSGMYYEASDGRSCYRGLRDWEIAAIVIGIVCFLILLFLLCCCLVCRRKWDKKKRPMKEDRVPVADIPPMVGPIMAYAPARPPGPLEPVLPPMPIDGTGVFYSVPNHFVSVRGPKGGMVMAKVEAADYVNKRVVVQMLEPVNKQGNIFKTNNIKEVVPYEAVVPGKYDAIRRGDYIQIVDSNGGV